MDTELDFENRDPNNINAHLASTFEEVIGEPDGVHSIDCIWKTTYCCFNCGKGCCYKLVTTLCGICIGLYWGCIFACLALEHIWCVTPMTRYWESNCACARRYYKSFVDCLLGPMCEVCSLFFNQIKVTNG